MAVLVGRAINKGGPASSGLLALQDAAGGLYTAWLDLRAA